MTIITLDTRGCGKPKVGGIYLNIGTSPNGIPFDSFLIDPTIPLHPDLKVPNLGMVAIDSGDINSEGNPIYHVFDHIGSEHYPNVFDWIEEQKRLGFHRKISPTFPYHLLTPESQYFGIHSFAGIKNPEPYAEEFLQTNLMSKCELHHQKGQTCIQFLTNDLIGEEVSEDPTDRRRIVRCPSFTYQGFAKPKGAQPVIAKRYVRSIFIRLPIGEMANFRFYTDGSKDVEKKKEKVEKKIPAFMGMEVINVK